MQECDNQVADEKTINGLVLQYELSTQDDKDDHSLNAV